MQVVRCTLRLILSVQVLLLTAAYNQKPRCIFLITRYTDAQPEFSACSIESVRVSRQNKHKWLYRRGTGTVR